ncbi:MAG: ATP-binding protein [Candidatus Microsaccharimonas sp.]
MTPFRLSQIWYRRLYVALFVASVGYVAIYLLATLTTIAIPANLQVDLISAIGGGLVAIATIVLFFLSKKYDGWLLLFIPFMVFTLTTAYLVQSTGAIESPFLPVWALLVFFAPLFSAYGWLPVIVIIGSYIAGDYLSSGSLSAGTLVPIILSSVVPLVAGVVLWRNTTDHEDLETKNVKHLATQLSEVAAKSEIVINAIGDGVIAVDGTGVIQLINPAAQEILGWGKQDALMLNYKSILKLADDTHDEIDPSLDPIQQVLNTNQQSRGSKLLAITNSGKKIAVAVVASPIGDPGSGAIAVFRDVTNERAEEREQAEFISTASHEMRTPVASIEGYLGLALNPNTATVDEKARDFIMKAHESAQHLGRLFQDLLDVSKSEDGRMTSVPKVLDLVPFTETIVQGLTPKATEKGLQIKFIPTAGTGQGQGVRKIMPVYHVNLDNDHIREVLDNLIENAIKYTPEGMVEVDVTGTEDKVIVSIKDSGLGIPTEDIPHLFQKFYRVENMDRQSIGGTGLGLYLCRRLVEAMQGRLWVESTFGSGSTFFVELPRISGQEAERLLAEQAQQASQSVLTPAPTPVPALAPAAPTPASTTSIPVTFADTPQGAPQPAPVAPAAPAVAPIAPIAPQAPAPTPIAPTPTQISVTAQQTTQPVAAPAAQQPVAQPQPVAMPAQARPQVAAQPQPQQPQHQAQPYPQAAPQQQQQTQPQPAPQAVPAIAPPGAKPATTVPRGETLTRDQINERVRQLEALAQQQRGTVTPQAR